MPGVVRPWTERQANLSHDLRPHMQGDRCFLPLCKRQHRPNLITFGHGNLHFERGPPVARDLPRVTSQITGNAFKRQSREGTFHTWRMQPFVAYATKSAIALKA